MLKQAVQSSNINEVAWDDGTLYITFHKSGTYAYPGVSEALYHQMVGAESVGRFFHEQIKGVYTYTKLEFAQSVE